MGKGRPANQFRIIGGRWRSRRLTFPDSGDLRPTPDRVRETLFNWLAPVVAGARCLDLFAGSGALGLEALSRGAAAVTFVDRDRKAVDSIRASLDTLGCTVAAVAEADVADYLSRPAQPCDIVFVDPPYRAGLIEPCLQLLAVRDWIRPGGRVYLEAEAGLQPALPSGWLLERDKRAGQVGYRLLRIPAAD